MKSRFSLLLCAVGIFIGGQSNAFANAWGQPIQCEPCSSAAALENVAIARGPGDYLVYSLKNNLIISVRVQNSGFPEDPAFAGTSSFTASQQPVPAEATEAFGGLRSLFTHTNGTNQAFININAHELGINGLGTAKIYDVMGNPNLIYQISDRLGDRNFIGSAQSIPEALRTVISMLVQGLLANFNAAPIPFITIRLETHDGGHMDFVIHVTSNRAEYLDNSARTPGGQWVPDDLSHGTWWGGQDDLLDLADYLRRLGASVSGSGSYALSCSWNGTELACILMAQ